MLADPLLDILTPDEYLEMEADVLLYDSEGVDKDRYQFDPNGYIEHYFGWSLWSGGENTGQQEIADAYVLSLRQQHERHAFNNGEVSADDLEYWTPGEPIQTIISGDAGHNVGKTKLASGLLNHFFDCFHPAIIYSYAPTLGQIKDLLWKEIKTDRQNAMGLPGRILDLRLEQGPNHFAKGQPTSNRGGLGTERAQGQHGDYLMFVVDEAEGVDSFVFDAIDSMASGGIAHIVLVFRNPKTSSCRAHKIRKDPNVNAMRISCLHHPNVITGRNIIPASVTRRWVDERIDDWCDIVEQHNPDKYTFETPWRDGIFEPADQRFLWRVMGIVGGQIADDVFCPLGRFESAVGRDEPVVRIASDSYKAQIGIDCARYGADIGTGYCYSGGKVWRYGEWAKKDSNVYFRDTRNLLERLKDQGITHVIVNVDGGGGFGSGIIDRLNADYEIRQWFKAPENVTDKKKYNFNVDEVHFNGKPDKPESFADRITEIYATAAERVKDVAIINPPNELEADFTQRKFRWVTKGRINVQSIEPKDNFKKRIGRSPDDGDGFALALADGRTKRSLVLW